MSLNNRILLGVILGIVLGFILSQLGADSAITKNVLYICQLVSTIFISLLKMVMVPLIFTSIAVGVSQLQAQHNMQKVWITTVIFFALSMAVAIVVGLLATHLLEPGKGVNINLFHDAMSQYQAKEMSSADFLTQFVGGLFANPIAAMAQGNIMAVLVFAIFVGVALVKSGDNYKMIRTGLTELLGLMMQLVSWIMYIAPFGVMALLTKLVATQNVDLFISLGKFIAVVIGGTLIHGVILLPLVLWLVTRISPWTFWQGAKPALITAFATSSSAATLPVTIKSLHENLNVPKPIANFVAPLGAQINMDGTALYEAAAALFIAQLIGLDLSVGQQLIVCFTAMLAAIGAPGLPSAGMVTMVMVLQSVGLPVEAIAILLPIDRLLDTFRTTVNVEGDMIGSLLVKRWVS
jgi:Na+/H+-dicarboxylate symporter